MASRRRMSVWELLARLGHRGDRDGIIQQVFEAASRVTFRSEDGGEPMDGGDFLVEVFESLGTTTDWPPCGSREWTRLREAAVRTILARLAREGLLDAVAVGNDGGTTAREGPHHDARGAAEPEWSGDGDPVRRRARPVPHGESAGARGGVRMGRAEADRLPGPARRGVRGRPRGGGHGWNQCRGEHPLRGRGRGMPGAGLAGAGAVAGAGRRPAGREAGGGGATRRDQAAVEERGGAPKGRPLGFGHFIVPAG